MIWGFCLLRRCGAAANATARDSGKGCLASGAAGCLPPLAGGQGRDIRGKVWVISQQLPQRFLKNAEVIFDFQISCFDAAAAAAACSFTT